MTDQSTTQFLMTEVQKIAEDALLLALAVEILQQ